MYKPNTFEFRVNYKIMNIDGLSFLSKPLSLCQEAALVISPNDKNLDSHMAGRILTGQRQIVFEYFPSAYGSHANFSLLPKEHFYEPQYDEVAFRRAVEKILKPGWNEVAEDKFTKFELLRDRFKIKAADSLAIVVVAKKELIKGLISRPQHAGGHTSDHATLYQNALQACDLILNKYDSYQCTGD